MARLPQPGGDNNSWGTILNNYLSVEHKSDGTLKKAADISEAKSKANQAVADAAAAQSTADDAYVKPTSGIPESDLSGSVQTKLNASGGSAAWGSITGTLADQTDLDTELTNLDSAASAAQSDATQALSDASAAQTDATQALSDSASAQSTANSAQTDATQALSDAATAQTAADAAVQSVVAGTNVTVDNTDPQNPVVNSTASGGVSDHGALTGLGDDDHTQYHTDARGDARYYTQTQLDGGQLDNRYYTETEVDTALSGKSDTGHSHTESDITDLDHDATKLQGNAVASTAPTDGQVLKWNNTASEWQPDDDLQGSTGTFVEGDGIAKITVASAAPSSPTVGDIWVQTA